MYYIYRIVDKKKEWLNIKVLGGQLIWTWKKHRAKAISFLSMREAIVTKKMYLKAFNISSKDVCIVFKRS
jgi:hypothetical protein